jgi:hypothetical protein
MNEEAPKTDKRVLKNIGLILLLIFIFPIGLYLMFKKSGWSKKSKIIATSIVSAVVALVVISLIFAPPTVTITSSLDSVNSDSYQLTGKIFPSGSLVTVNGVQAKVDGDAFSINAQLKEGDNTLKVVVTSGDKRTEQEFKIHRYTKAEVIAQEKAAAKKEADEAAAAAKKKADDAAAAQAKQQQAADAKAKADADAAAKAAEDKVAADAAAKAKALANATVSQKNALSKAKSYLSYTAFSHDGLVDQLVYEQFSTADATYGADNVGANWNEQAAKKAKDYMSHSSFSRGGLIDQLEYEKFTPDQATYGANSVGL